MDVRIGVDSADPAGRDFCPIAVYPDDRTLEWLTELHPPRTAIDYFNRIAIQQETIERECR